MHDAMLSDRMGSRAREGPRERDREREIERKGGRRMMAGTNGARAYSSNVPFGGSLRNQKRISTGAEITVNVANRIAGMHPPYANRKISTVVSAPELPLPGTRPYHGPPIPPLFQLAPIEVVIW